jgi:pimeloyl-ACP methyl ester carboxylesterase
MLVVGSGAIAVLGGVVVKRLATPSPVDLLGAIAGISGVVLVVLGWRRLLGGLGRGWLRAIAAVLGTFVVAQFLLLPAILALDVTNRTRPAGSGETPASRGLAFADVRIVADDGVALAAWWVPPRNGAAVIVLPGSGSTRDDVLDHAALVAGAGYGALLPDPRGHGDSGGRGMEFGWGAELDVPALATWVLARPEVTRLGLLGLSMGGEVALTAAADDPRIGAVVAEGASARTWDDARREPDPHPVGIANEWVMFGLVGLLAPEAPPRPLVEAVDHLEAPTLLIVGAPANEAGLGPVYAAAAPGAVTLWSLPDTPHVGGLSTHPAAYRERVLGHLDAALLGR